MKISEEDLKRLFDSENDLSGPNDDWEGFDVAKEGEVEEIPSISENIKVKKTDRKIENEITIKKIRKKIAKTPQLGGKTNWNKFVDSFLKLLTFAGISGFVVFASLNFPAYFSQSKWLYYTQYLGQRMPKPNNQISQTPQITPVPTQTSVATSDINLMTVTPYLPVSTLSILNIDKINVQAPITWNVDENDIISNLINGVAHYKGTSLPGQGGNVFIVGHSSNSPWVKSDYNHVFAILDKLVNGDRITLTYAGKTFTYEVVEKKVVSANDVEVLDATNKETLSIMTCWPVGTTLNRLLIISNLKQTS